MRRLRRIIAVTIGLVVTGAVAGAFAGGVAFTFVLILYGPLNSGLLVDAFLIAAIVGAPIGAVTAPSLAWMLLRRVPLGRMFRGLSLGTMLGGVLGWLTTVPSGNIVINAVASAFIGCVVAALLLRREALHRLEA